MSSHPRAKLGLAARREPCTEIERGLLVASLGGLLPGLYARFS